MHLRSETERAFLQIYFTQGLGPASQRKILEKMGDPFLENWSRFQREIHGKTGRWEGIDLKLLQRTQEPSVMERAEAEEKCLKRQQGRLISLLDPEFPPLLRVIHHPPAFLFLRGPFGDWENRTPIAFVGTRGATEYGKKAVEALIEGLAGASVTIVSGFASGIDTFAHEAALRCGLPTVGILGTGLDYIYPRENEGLYYQMAERGLLITQFPTQTPPGSWNFPERNRIISGVSRGVVVVEAPSDSGALITADFAMEEGREVLAVPGSILSAKNKGCHRLISQGAKLVNGSEDILEELNIPKDFSNEKPKANFKKIEVNSEEALLMTRLTAEPLHIDKITEMSNLAPSLVASSLTM